MANQVNDCDRMNHPTERKYDILSVSMVLTTIHHCREIISSMSFCQCQNQQNNMEKVNILFFFLPRQIEIENHYYSHTNSGYCSAIKVKSIRMFRETLKKKCKYALEIARGDDIKCMHSFHSLCWLLLTTAEAAYGTAGVKTSCDSLACTCVSYIIIVCVHFCFECSFYCYCNAHNATAQYSSRS